MFRVPLVTVDCAAILWSPGLLWDVIRVTPLTILFYGLVIFLDWI